MKSWLFVWNPNNYKWDDQTYGYNELRNDISQLGYAFGKWSCGVNKSIRKGDRIFLIRLGVRTRGIVASGFAETGVFEGSHWDRQKAAEGVVTRCIYIRFDKILNIDADEFFHMKSFSISIAIIIGPHRGLAFLFTTILQLD